ncbi:tail fiber assembly protein [Yersinia proxima]|uniref:tail fiber assembly protein n=1 Tax=Yersinia proxima TaxID=2890316 RepID=UPI001D11B1FF|nr:tail fiber assembly protein [Yersinia proxima]
MKNLDTDGEVPDDELLVVDEEIIYDDLFVAVYKDETGLSVVNFNSQASLDSFNHDDYFLIIERSKLPDQKYQAAWEFNGERNGIVVNSLWLQEMQVAEAERERNHKIWLVQDELTALQTDLMLGIIDDEDTTHLIKLKKYVIALKQLDVATAPDVIWPELSDVA